MIGVLSGGSDDKSRVTIVSAASSGFAGDRAHVTVSPAERRSLACWGVPYGADKGIRRFEKAMEVMTKA
jgi:hypothetical protein